MTDPIKDLGELRHVIKRINVRKATFVNDDLFMTSHRYDDVVIGPRLLRWLDTYTTGALFTTKESLFLLDDKDAVVFQMWEGK